MSGSKKNKIKKQSALPPPVLNQDDDHLVDDLLAQLNSRDQTAQAEPANSLNDISETPVQKQDVKSRFKARQVTQIGHFTGRILN